MIMWSAASLIVFFGLASSDYYHEPSWSTREKIYFVFFNELPFFLAFLGHWIVYY